MSGKKRVPFEGVGDLLVEGAHTRDVALSPGSQSLSEQEIAVRSAQVPDGNSSDLRAPESKVMGHG